MRTLLRAPRFARSVHWIANAREVSSLVENVVPSKSARTALAEGLIGPVVDPHHLSCCHWSVLMPTQSSVCGHRCRSLFSNTFAVCNLWAPFAFRCLSGFPQRGDLKKNLRGAGVISELADWNLKHYNFLNKSKGLRCNTLVIIVTNKHAVLTWKCIKLVNQSTVVYVVKYFVSNLTTEFRFFNKII